MFIKLLKRLGYVAAGGLLVFSFLLLAQVNMDDLRHKLGQLLLSNDPILKAGGLYIVNASGHVLPGRPPVCNPAEDLVEAHFSTAKGHVTVRNSLGYAVPAIARMSAYLLAPHEALAASSTGKVNDLGIDIEDHTIAIDWVETTQLKSDANMGAFLGSLYEANPACERTIDTYWRQGRCVALVHRVTKVDETMIGYTYNKHCMVPDVDEELYKQGPIIAAQPKLRMTARLSQIKDFFGLISYEPPIYQTATSSEG